MEISICYIKPIWQNRKACLAQYFLFINNCFSNIPILISTDLLSKSIAVVTEGQSLLEKIKELGENAPKEETQVTLAACGGIQKAVEELMQRRKMLEDLLSQKRKRLNQFATVGELDQELNKVRKRKGDQELRQSC